MSIIFVSVVVVNECISTFTCDDAQGYNGFKFSTDFKSQIMKLALFRCLKNLG